MRRAADQLMNQHMRKVTGTQQRVKRYRQSSSKLLQVINAHCIVTDCTM